MLFFLVVVLAICYPHVVDLLLVVPGLDFAKIQGVGWLSNSFLTSPILRPRFQISAFNKGDGASKNHKSPFIVEESEAYIKLWHTETANHFSKWVLDLERPVKRSGPRWTLKTFGVASLRSAV